MAGEWIWNPDRAYIEQTNAHRFLTRLGLASAADLRRYSTERPDEFWEEMAREVSIEWFGPYSAVRDSSRGPEWSRWFVGGRLNIAWNCLDRHCRNGRGGEPAILWEGEDAPPTEVTFGVLQRETNRLANALRTLGMRQGDRVALYLPMVPEAVTVLYACFRLGLVAVPIFSGFGYAAVASRLEDSGARLLITADFLKRRGRVLPLKEKADSAVAGRRSIEKVVVLRYQGGNVPWTAGRDLWWHELVASQSAECDLEPLDSEHPALLLYTSGTTGKPKGAVHTHAGALIETSKEIYLAFDHRTGDRFFWVSDIGWMMGPWAIIGNHHFGGTVVLCDGAPDYPAPDRFWDIIERHRVHTFGISPTAIRLLMRYGSGPLRKHDLTSLRLLGSTGEPWDDTSYRWFESNAGAGRCPVINISGGTEIIGCFLHPLPMEPIKACSLGGPAPGMATDIFDEEGRSVRGKVGYLVCTGPAPSMTRGIWRDPERYIEAYWSRFPGAWYHGDWASTDADGCWFLHGRADEALNVAGRKVGPAEVEDALIDHPAVAEAAVIGVPHELTGEAIAAFVVPKAGLRLDAALLEEISAHLERLLGPTFRPVALRVVAELPKTQSGKIVRRLIRQAYLGEALGDTSTVDRPALLEQFRRGQPPSDA